MSAQLRQLPYSQRFSVQSYGHSSAKTEALSLPFLDDFSLATTGLPENRNWINGGTRVSNTLSVNHPSLNVVSFDGQDAKGKPYNLENQFANGSADTLTSQAIDLSKNVTKDSLYLSFFWQAKGLGELPDTDDSLRLQFLTDGGIWRTVWKQIGDKRDKFTQVLLPIKANFYLHAGFRFRFQSFGRLSGNFDTWLLDYIYLNKNRSFNNTSVVDISARKAISPIIKGFNTMPLSHFLKNNSKFLADSIKTDVVNQNANNNFFKYKFTLIELGTGLVLQSFSETNDLAISKLTSRELRQKLALNTVAFNTKSVKLKSKFEVVTTDDNQLASTPNAIPGLNLRMNDTISSVTTLDNYYAYDDGSAEYSAGVNSRLARVALRYVFASPDAMTGLQFNFAQTIKSLEGQNLIIQVSANNGGKPGKVLYQKAVPISYTKDGFVEYPFDVAVPVKDTVFVGYLQLTDDEIAIGLDKNSTSVNKDLYYNLGLEWIQNSEIIGHLMLRPVIGGVIPTIVTATEPTIIQEEVTLFPNPVSDILRWNANRFTKVNLFDMMGKLLIDKEITENSLDISEITSGLYFVRLSNFTESVIKKVLIKK